VADRGAVVTDVAPFETDHQPIGIVELGRICDEQWAVGRGWFATLGGWVSDEPAPALQRLYATASHRHAWHADLWRARRPTIPPVQAQPDPDPAPIVVDAEDRSAAYREGLATMRRSLDELRARIDPDLDPSTVRVIDLVSADLADLATTIDGLDV
jgi:hypothetical protein